MPLYNPNLCDMIVIRVFANWAAVNGDRPLFERQIVHDPAISFPGDQVGSVLKLLYGQKSVVIFFFD